MKFSAHAYIVQGTVGAVDSILTLLESDGVNTQNNPDVLVQTYSNFTIDDARSLRDRASLQALGKRGRIFILAAPTIPVEAQNALLKTFEEPSAQAQFFLIVSSPETLLPTLRSRMQPLQVADSGSDIPAVDAKTFLSSPPEKRITMLSPLLEKGDDDKRDISGALRLLGDIERVLSKNPVQHAHALRAVYRARMYIVDRGALVKALLEQVALLIPKVI